MSKKIKITNMENTENIQPTESVITVNGDIKNYLLETAKWCKFNNEGSIT